MNRLILIGNGFDLAHGLKTSYQDFIIGHLTECFLRVDPYKFDYHDDLLSVRISHPIDFKDFIRQHLEEKRTSFLLQKKEIKGFFKLCYKQGVLWHLFNIDKGIDIAKYNKDANKIQFLQKISTILEIRINSNLYKTIISSCFDCNWVDIENEYFEALKKCKNKDNIISSEKVKQLNKELDFLKRKLYNYLNDQQKISKPNVNDKLARLINETYKLSDFEPAFKEVSEFKFKMMLGLDGIEKDSPSGLHVLNFNYTNTFSNYIESV
jgi:hypothetical protein